MPALNASALSDQRFAASKVDEIDAAMLAENVFIVARRRRRHRGLKSHRSLARM